MSGGRQLPYIAWMVSGSYNGLLQAFHKALTFLVGNENWTEVLLSQSWHPHLALLGHETAPLH